MNKKIIVLLLTAIIFISFSACKEDKGIEKNMFFNVDFSTGSIEDSVGKVARSKTPAEVVFENDSELNKKVGIFEKAGINYLVDYTKMAETFTMEAYVNVEKQGSYGLICGTYWFGSKLGVGFGAGVFDLDGDKVGENKVLSMFGGNGSSSNTVGGGEFGKWVHLVFVHDKDKDYYYVDGVDMTDGGIASASETMHHDDNAGFRIGSYNTVPQFPIDKMKAAYVRIYDVAAGSDTVKSLYENRNA